MNVGVCKITIRVPENQTLKGKRRVIKSLKDRLRRKFNVSVAEVENHQSWQISTLGVICVSDSSHHVDEIIQKVVMFLENAREDIELVDEKIENISGF